MLRLKEQQLHMLIWMMVAASVLFFVLWGAKRVAPLDEKSAWKGMQDYSGGWICTYETTNDEKLKAYQKQHASDMAKEDSKKGSTIVEVVTLPYTFQVERDSTIVMTNKLPEMDLDTLYATMKIENANIRVLVEEDIIYSSNAKEEMLPVRHIVPLLAEYEDRMITIELSNLQTNTIQVGAFQSGNYNQLWVTTLKASMITLATGLILICAGLCMLVAWIVVQNTWQQKRLLLYSSVEGLLLGVMCLLDTEVVPLLTGWNYGVFMLKSCVVLLAIILHLTIIRCFIYKKKVLGIIDTGVLCVGILYISVMVLQMFSLVQFDTIYTIGIVLYGLVIVLFTIVLAITVFDYQRREGMPVFIANVFLIVAILAQIIMEVTGRGGSDRIYVRIGFLLYMIYIWVFGLRQATFVQPVKEEATYDESDIRAQVVEQMNPNLIFASFQTLQSLIKNGSPKSVKMIYYISVYFKNNLQALESENSIISFADEMEHIIAYLQLQRTRNHNLNFAIECKAKDFNVPRHSLEPLVENAVKHGIANNDNQGNVAVRSYMRADGYAVQIVDDGAGFDMSILKKKNTTVAKKLALLEKTCQARTEVISREGKGTVITIVFPMLENDLMDEMFE